MRGSARVPLLLAVSVLILVTVFAVVAMRHHRRPDIGVQATTPSDRSAAVPAGDSAVIEGVAIEGNRVVVRLRWPATASGEDGFALLAAFGVDAAGLASFIAGNSRFFTLGLGTVGVTDPATGKGVYTSVKEVRASDRLETEVLDVPSDIEGTGTVAVGLYIVNGETLRAASNAVQTSWSSTSGG